MPKKQKGTEQGCSEFEPDFTLRETRDSVANWDLGDARKSYEWPPDCAQAFKEAVARMRRKFDIAWPWPA